MRRYQWFLFLIVLILAAIACTTLSCSNSSGTVNQADPAQNDQANPTKPPEEEATPIPITPVETTLAPTETVAPTSTSIPAPTLNTSDIQSVLTWFLFGLQHQEMSQIMELIPADGVRYANYLEGIQFVSPEDFVAQLNQRLGSDVQCDEIVYYQPMGFWQIWTSNWTPEWEITELCYIECAEMDPVWKSARAGFFFKQINSEWQLDINYLNTMDKYFFGDSYQSFACPSDSLQLEIDLTSAWTCPGSPPPRLEISGYAYVSNDPPLSNRVRSQPGISYPVVGQIKPGGEMEILDGPTCVDNWTWWKVRELSTNLTGWTVEGDGSQYWLIPTD